MWLRGACAGCPSSATLKDGIERLLTSKLDVVQSVVASTEMADSTRIGSQRGPSAKRGAGPSPTLRKRLASSAPPSGPTKKAGPGTLGVLVRLAHSLDVSLDTLVLGEATHPWNKTSASSRARGPERR